MATGISVGWGLAAPAGAVTGDPITDQCTAAFGSQTTSPISLTTNPPARSIVQPGQHVQLDVNWNPGWDSLSSVLVCVRVGGKINRDLSMIESPGVDDGTLHHDFTIPDGLVDGEAICVRGVMTGKPAGTATQETFVSRQACFDVPVPQETGPPTTTPTTAPAPASTTASSPSAPAPPPAGSVSDETPPPQPAAPPADLYTDSPGESAAGSGDAPGFPVFAPAPASGGGPTPLPILPETGFGNGGRDLAGLGFAAVGLGLPTLYFGRRRRRTVFGGWS
jgi:LPXTG-motif cell wall-anchored protein